jgi:hypothetical protein
MYLTQDSVLANLWGKSKVNVKDDITRRALLAAIARGGIRNSCRRANSSTRGGGQLRSTALMAIPVGVVVERRKARSAWVDFLWRPVSVFAGKPTAAPWTPLDTEADTTLFFAGQAVIELHRTETTNYRDNLASRTPALWIALRPVASERPYEILTVTADPAEGEAFTDAGSNLVEAVPMPPDVVEVVVKFIAQHHVARPFVKRQRDQQTTSSHRRVERESEQ